MNNEKLLARELGKYFNDIEKEVQALLNEYGPTSFLLQGQVEIIISPIKNSHNEYYDIIKKHIIKEFNLGTREGDRLVKLNNPQITNNILNEIRRNNLFGTLEWTEQKLLNETFIASEGTLSRVTRDINNILTTGYTEGKGIKLIANDITQRFNQLSTWESNRIARTEIHTAHNQGIMKSYETLGVEYTQWITAGDDRVRGLDPRDTADHAALDGEIIEFGGTYSNGLSFPGDTSGDIEEWINCRCAHAPFIMPPGMMAPPGMAQFTEDDLIPING